MYNNNIYINGLVLITKHLTIYILYTPMSADGLHINIIIIIYIPTHNKKP